MRSRWRRLNLFRILHGVNYELSFDETHFSHDTLLELEEFSLASFSEGSVAKCWLMPETVVLFEAERL